MSSFAVMGEADNILGAFLMKKIFHILPWILILRVQEAAAAGDNVIYGDASRSVVLEAAGGARAKALVISYNDAASAMKILHMSQDKYPHLPVIVRTVDDTNIEAFREAGASEVVPEILEGSLMLASHALVLLDVPLSRVIKRIRMFREERYKMFRGFFQVLPMPMKKRLNGISRHVCTPSLLMSRPIAWGNALLMSGWVRIM